MIRDSINSPLRVDSVRLESGGEIGMTICPGKHEESAFSGTWARDLKTDIGAIAKWGASAVVTLMERDELAGLKAGKIGDAVERAGMDWHFLPIADVKVPDDHFEDLWIYSGHVLRRALADGRKILIHCKGGLGRTGTIAARLMVELGERPGQAIKSVRKARPGAIETPAQERHVGDSKPPRTDAATLDRILGCLLGGAVGDAFGYAVEFDHWTRIKERFGAGGIMEPVVDDGQIRVSDDTQMTLFTLEALVQSMGAEPAAIVERIGLAYLDWLYTQGDGPRHRKPVGSIALDPALHHRRAPGNTCLAALRQGGNGSPERPLNDSKGCGGVMRAAPIGLLARLAPPQAADLAARAAALTHGHPSGYISAAALAAMVRLMLDGADLRAAALKARPMLARWKDCHETDAKIGEALLAARRSGKSHRTAVASLGEGWVGEEALAVGLYSALAAKSFSEVFSISANHDGDSDSTASIAGQLYGVRFGLADLPNQWIRRLDILGILLGLVRRMFR